MELKKEIRILGRRFEVEPRAKESLKGITVGEKLSYRFYDGTYQGTPLLFVEPKKGNPSPRTCAITGKRLTEALDCLRCLSLRPDPPTSDTDWQTKESSLSCPRNMPICQAS